MRNNDSSIRSRIDRQVSMFKLFATVILMSLFFFHGYGQQSSLPCNGFEPWVPATFTVVESHSSPGLACWEGDVPCPGPNVPANVINSDTTDFATGDILGIGSLTLSVKDNTNNYTGGNYVGFVVSSGLFNIGLFSSITITTYLEDVQQEDYQAVNLIGFSSAFLAGPINIGFVTTLGYDEIEITIDNLLGIGSYNVHYAVMEKFCAGPALSCNEETSMNQPTFPVAIDYANTGSSGVSVAIVENPENAVSASTTDYASLVHVASVAGSSFLTVEEQTTDYPAGTFVGFDIENLSILSVGVLNYVTITSYLNDVQQESLTGTALLAGVPLLSSSGRYTVGFVTGTSVDKVKITLQQPVGITLGTTRVYSAIFQAFCAGPALDCNVQSILTKPDYPVLIDLAQTGFTGAACGGCTLVEPGDVIDDDTSSYAQIIMTAGVLTVGSLAVKDQLTDYVAGTFAGFRIENPNLVDVDALTGITISTYLNGAFQQSQTNAGALVSVGSDLLANDDQQVVGFVTTLPFDEVKISLNNVGAFNIGTTRIHEFTITQFCPASIVCDTTYFLNAPEFPVYIDAFRTGVDGVACVGCSVVGEESVITADTTDYALITVVANVASSASLAVADALYTYPAGTFAGFVIEDLGLLLEADLFASLTISTYNNGVLQESKTGGDLLDLALIILFISDENGRYNVGFETTLPFDEIRITVGSLVAAINLVRVYGAFVDTRASNGGSLICNDAPLANPDLATTNEDTPVIIDVLANDNDMDDTLGIPSVTTLPDHGTTTVNGDSTITYTPDPDFVGQDTFIYTVCDPQSVCDTALVTVSVLPQIDTVMYTIPEDDTVQVCSGELTTFSEPATAISACDPPSNGSTTIIGDCITYHPDPDFTGADTFCVYVCHPDFPMLCDTTIVIVEVTPLNDPPVAQQDSVSVPEDMPVIIDVLANDSDPDNPLGIPAVTDPPDHGMVTVNSDSTITYTPDPDFVGLDTFTYAICDPQPLCDTALVIVFVSPQMDTVTYTIPEDGMQQVCADDLTTFSEPATSMSTCDLPSNGSVMITGACATYTPDSGYNGMDTFCVYVCHPDLPMICDTTIIIITVTPVNEPPVAQPDVATTPEDMPVIIPVLNNDSDPDNSLGTPSVTDSPDHGMTTVNPDGTITYTPDPNYFGPDTFIYTLCDPEPLCDTALVTINVTPLNDGPLAQPDVATTPEDMPVIIPVLTNDSDPDNPLGPPAVTDPPDHGMTTVNPDGTITYTPDPDYFGPDTFIYTLCDPGPLCDTALVTINVTPVNDGPLAQPDVATTPEDMPVIIPVLNNDSDPDSPLGPPAVTDPPDHGMTTVNPDGTITYTPDPGYFGPDTFIYTLCDPQPFCDTALVTINVFPAITINCPPNLVIECGSANYAGQITTWISTATGSGGCTGTVTITSDYDGSSVPELSCDLSSGLMITFTATDECGNSATCTATVYLDDSTAPVVTPGVIASCYNSMDEAIAAAIAATLVTDNCATAGEISFDVDISAGPFCDSIITLTVSDVCGNSATASYQTMINCQTIRLHVWMEGSYNTTGDSMHTTMNADHTLPGQINASPFIYDAPAGQPYQGAPWNYAGNLGNSFGDGAGMTPYPADVVDWVLVTVRHNGILPANNIWTCAGWVHRDGTVTFPENCPGPAINTADDYYLLVQHRNHLGILSPSFVNILCNGAVLDWDFRNSNSYQPVFRFGQKEVEPGVWAMFDANGEQMTSIAAINSTDRTLWRIWQGFLGYSPGDYDLNAATNSTDETIWKINQNKTSGVVFY